MGKGESPPLSVKGTVKLKSPFLEWVHRADFCVGISQEIISPSAVLCRKPDKKCTLYKKSTKIGEREVSFEQKREELIYRP